MYLCWEGNSPYDAGRAAFYLALRLPQYGYDAQTRGDGRAAKPLAVEWHTQAKGNHRRDGSQDSVGYKSEASSPPVSCILVSRLKFCLGKRMKFILASLLFVGCLHCEPLSVDVDIEEDGTRYKQKVEYDPVTKVVSVDRRCHQLYEYLSRPSPTECLATTMSSAASTLSTQNR